MELPLKTSTTIPTVAPEDVEQALTLFSQACVCFAKVLQEGPELSDLQRLSVENNLAIVQLNYTYWVRQLSTGKYPRSVD